MLLLGSASAPESIRREALPVEAEAMLMLVSQIAYSVPKKINRPNVISNRLFSWELPT